MADRVVVVTGSASGIGRATCARLAADGDRVIGVDLRDADLIADLSTPEGCARMGEEAIARAGGTIDAVVANAGVIGSIPLCYAVNYRGAIGTLEALRPGLARSKAPRVSVTVSMAAGLFITLAHAEALERGEDPEVADAGQAYAASKLALARWIRRSVVSPDWGLAGIPVNGLCPGIIDTPMGVESLLDPIAEGLVPQTPLARIGQPEEMAAIHAFLISADNSYMMGQLLFADGGLNARLRPDLV